MTLPIVFRAAARGEFDDAVAWYEARRAGLGAEFVAQVQEVLENVAARPQRYPIALNDVREAPVRRFPYCIYYRVHADRVAIVAVFHTARSPAAWQMRT